MLSPALAIYGRNFGALILTCALALIPANLLMAGAVSFGLSTMGVGGLAEARTTHTEQVQEKRQKLAEKPPDTPEDRDQRVRQLGREAFEGKTTFDAPFLRGLLPLAYGILIGLGLLLTGVALAQAAVVPLIFDIRAGRPTGPAQAWNVIGTRFGALLKTALFGVPLIALGFLFLAVPGIIAAMGFSFAIPVTVTERISGRAALERSWELCRGRWGALFGVWMIILVITALASGAALMAPIGPWRSLVSGAVRLALYPIPLVALVLLYQRALSTSAESPRLDSSARGSLDNSHP